jgi:GDPmannose 4,6-dehydratase
MKKVIITGVAGMDGSILAEKLLDKGYKVIGIDRWFPTGTSVNLANCINNKNFIHIEGDITEKQFIETIVKKYKPDYFYNLAAISLVPQSFKIPITIFETNTMAVINMLEIIKNSSPKTRFYQASTSEQIGKNIETPQNTESKMIPNSPYAVAKLATYHMVRLYREAYGLFACNGMLWNHEGPRRGPDFVTRKITLGVANIFHFLQEYIELGNLDAYRDWGNAEDYCDAMIKIMEANEPDDYAVATGETHSVREFVEEAFKRIDMKITWKGKGIKEVGCDQNGDVRVKINKKFYRPAEVALLHGDPSKIKKKLGWEPTTKFKDLVRLMINHDLNKNIGSFGI